VYFARSKALEKFPHAFLGRQGGASNGIYSSLNVGLGSGDDPLAVSNNRRCAAEAILPGASLATLYQIHSAEVVTVTETYANGDRPHADAMVSKTRGLLLGILTADCAPVLFADVEAGVIGAAHAGWKGALGGVTDATVAAMEALGARRDQIVAAVGPCIAQASYEVDEPFTQRFDAADPENERFFKSGRAGHHQFDLEGYVASRLAGAGILRVEAMGIDTYSNPDRYFSFRRATHKGESDYGRQISLIALA
jgi:polyphenol oxidase